MSQDAFFIRRSFDAPRELVWRVYTEREHLMRWFGPQGFEMPKAELDFRVGGTFLYCLRADNGVEMWGKWIFRDIVAPEKLAVITAFCDAEGRLTRHPMASEWPLETLGTTTFEEIDGKTVVSVHWEAVNATEAERRVFADNTAGMTMGWTGTFDRLEAYLAQQQG